MKCRKVIPGSGVGYTDRYFLHFGPDLTDASSKPAETSDATDSNYTSKGGLVSVRPSRAQIPIKILHQDTDYLHFLIQASKSKL